MKKEKLILAIETSCDDTAMCIMSLEKGEIVNSLRISQIDHERFGGVVPELASRKHFSNIMPLTRQLFEDSNIEYHDIDFVAVTYAPGLLGSLLIGTTAAKTFAYATDATLVPVHHIEGHIYASSIDNNEMEYPFIALVISGGHTQLVLIKGFGDYEVIGDTLDDSVGEAFDKVARMLGLAYPGGPIIDRLAKKGQNDLSFPRPKLRTPDLDFSFSGLKTAVKNYIEKNDHVSEDVALSFQNAVCDVLVKKSIRALKRYNINKLVLAGGVSANSQLRETMKKKIRGVILPEIKHCTDNADMIAAAARYRILNNSFLLDKKDFMRLNPVARMLIDEERDDFDKKTT
ncbi:MAG: tRNA (adenosine(37)-N6)-threonylcarbamoyltransferase complex transferase subunit TsaD [Candidatus Muiribacterium halophilum]|uniref:tRNA N6-adenosine threonylcarbamoyltransferase n=1 Tax=Muiribacterium halophilum TaxID=2053465 RepID=A0A2N5ZMC7_MUIH1|nr:MAG: tRNA (adenosine(37)-N6)-threonylcarbamoyltransferase complex transferase subunit TsaD [Candidatus Muirbacterium halophilum]